ncbi:hypothetical protein H9P43_001992 [Blastocladiella emersonii ATCC 22665]|nr:hypothetical protein H9P43_001992 [Blastocladiella emersonii ATCC 22665]
MGAPNIPHRPLRLATDTSRPARDLVVVLGSSSKFRRGIVAHLLPTDASASPRVTLDYAVPDIDEKAVGLAERAANDASALTAAVAHAKTDALEPVVRARYAADDRVVLLITSDQVIVNNGEIREKPESPEQAKAYLTSYAKHPAEAVNGIVVTDVKTGRRVARVEIGVQHWRAIPEHVMDAVIAKGEIMHCAGGFMIDDELLQPYLAERIGDEDTIIGMPLQCTRELLEEAYAAAVATTSQ